jgi:hypothetical protein
MRRVPHVHLLPRPCGQLYDERAPGHNEHRWCNSTKSTRTGVAIRVAQTRMSLDLSGASVQAEREKYVRHQMKATQLERFHDSDRQVKCVYGDDLDVCAQALQKKACKATEVLSQWSSGRTGDLIHTSTTAFMRVLAILTLCPCFCSSQSWC